MSLLSITSEEALADRVTEEVLMAYGYTMKEKLGEGSYARVRKVVYRNGRDRATYAVKIMDRLQAPLEFLTKFFPRELDTLIKLNHKNVIKTQAIFEIQHHLCIVMELAVGGDLLQYVLDNGALVNDPGRARMFFGQIVAGVAYIHDLKIAHRDLKLENLLLDSNLNIKVTDFGFARQCYDEIRRKWSLSATFCGSTAYAPPEVISSKPYYPLMMDIWALGIILFIMMTSSMPFDDKNLGKMLRQMYDGPIRFPAKHQDKIPTDIKHMIHYCAQVDPPHRPTADDLYRHVFAQDADYCSCSTLSYECFE